MVKISFLGDIMCEEPMLNAAKIDDRDYDFSRMFSGLRESCKQSDYVVGNLETPFAGEDKKYTHEMYAFNTPDCFAEAVKEAGINLVLTANNHCYDRGIDGMKRTIEVLNSCDLAHVGTFAHACDDVPFQTTLEGIRVAVIACTASTNPVLTRLEPSNENVCLLDKQTVHTAEGTGKGVLRWGWNFAVKNVIGEMNYMKFRKRIGLSPKRPKMDNTLNKETAEPYIEHVCSLIREAKTNSDIVFVCPHMGGQFNIEPGAFSKYVMSRLVDAGADAVVACHPHIIQKMELKGKVPCAFSLGNVSMSLSTAYVIRNELPDYGMMLHFYLEDKSIRKITYSLIKMNEDEKGYITVGTVYNLYQNAEKQEKKKIRQDAQRVIRRIMQSDEIEINDISEEWEFCNFES